MRIVDICPFYTAQGGGVKSYVEYKLKAAKAWPHEVVIVVPGDVDGLVHRDAGASVVALSAPRFPLDRRYRYFNDESALHALLDALRPDVLEVSSPWGSASMVARWNGRCLRSLVMHADPLSAYAYRWFGSIASRETIDRSFAWFWRYLRRLDSEYDIIVSGGVSLSRRLIAGGLSKVATIPMGVEPGLFSPSLRDEALRARLLAQCSLGPDATLLVAAGRLAPEKRWPLVIEAVTAAGYGRPVGMILFGSGREAGKIARSVHHNPHIRLADPITGRSELARILASADALVHGCEVETFCMMAAEAKASGLPLLVPDEGGAGDQFVPGQGLSYASRSASALSTAILQFVEEGPRLHGLRAIASAEQVPTMDDHFERLLQAYADHLERRVHAA
jgi:alpha-1,6-mannosyltransferase